MANHAILLTNPSGFDGTGFGIMTIYPDTNVWNALCDQEIDPARLGAALFARDASLVLSYHTVYEFLKTFLGSGDKARLRGAKLFSCLNDPIRAAKALVRADLYFNWRCAHRGSNPKDLYDDMYHVMGAIYCDTYVTKEPAQAEYAHLLLTRNTGVHIYPSEIPVDVWLESLTSKQPLVAA